MRRITKYAIYCIIPFFPLQGVTIIWPDFQWVICRVKLIFHLPNIHMIVGTVIVWVAIVGWLIVGMRSEGILIVGTAIVWVAIVGRLIVGRLVVGIVIEEAAIVWVQVG